MKNRTDRDPPYMTRTELALLIVLGLLAATMFLSRAQGQEHEPSTDDAVPTLSDAASTERVIVRAALGERIEWDDSVRLAVGQCLVAEARWRNRTEHSAILHVLERRWRRYNANHPDAPIAFERQVRQFCHLHRSPEDSTSRWALNLPWGPLVADPGMPSGSDWRRWRDDWEFVRETVGMFERGDLHDPMPLAMTFGGDMDSGGVGLVYLGPWTHSIENGERILLHNRFYALQSTIARAAARR